MLFSHLINSSTYLNYHVTMHIISLCSVLLTLAFLVNTSPAPSGGCDEESWLNKINKTENCIKYGHHCDMVCGDCKVMVNLPTMTSKYETCRKFCKEVANRCCISASYSAPKCEAYIAMIRGINGTDYMARTCDDSADLGDGWLAVTFVNVEIACNANVQYWNQE